MHDDGEVDVRGCYTAVATAAMLDILTPSLTDEALIDYIARCQTFEGGLGGDEGLDHELLDQLLGSRSHEV